MQEDEDPCSVL